MSFSAHHPNAILLRAASALIISLATFHVSAYGPLHTPATSSIEHGDEIVLNQPISASSGSKIFIQNGEVRKGSAIRQAKPYCYFNLYRSSSIIDTATTVNADRFEIASARNRLDVVSAADDGVAYALGGGFITQDASEQTLVTRINFRAGNQPEVTGLHCAIWAVPHERSHLSLEEMRGALGEIVTLRLKADS